MGGLFKPDKGKLVWMLLGIAAGTYAGLGKFLPRINRG